MQICTQCGHENESSATFCGNRDCGAVLEWHGQRADGPMTDQRVNTAVKPDKPAEARQRRIVAVQATLAPTMLDVEPGESATSELSVRNQGTIVDQFGVKVTGPAAGWATCEPPSINLFPGSEGTVTVRFAPPHAPNPAAGAVPFQAQVTSSQDPTISVVEGGMVNVAPFEDMHAQLSPETGQGRRGDFYQLTTENRGNTPANLAVHAQDPDQRLHFDVAPSSLHVPRGESQTTGIDVQAKQRHWIGSPQNHPFTVVATRPDDPVRTPVFQRPGALRQKAILPYWLLALIALLLVLGLLALLFLRSDNVTVPSVIGQSHEVAERTLTAAGLTLGQTEYQLSEETPGTVIAQEPDAEARVEPGTQVDITVAAEELIDVPRLVGITIDEAEATLADQNLVLGDVTEEPSAEDAGTVLSQQPGDGELVPPGTEIDITVAVHVPVPRVVGQSEGPAQQALREAGLELNVAGRENHDQPEGVVIRQDPAAQELVPAGTVVDVILSLGPDDGDDDTGNGNGNGNGNGDATVVVPNVVGDRLTDARTRVQNAQLQVGTITQDEVDQGDATGPSGRVVTQNPQAAGQVQPGTPVDLTVRAVVVYRDAHILQANQWIDLDIGDFGGGEIGAPPDADLRWTTEEVVEAELTPLGGAQFAHLGTMELSEFDELRLDELEEADFSGAEIRASEITEGTVIAIRTNEGNIAKFVVVERLMPMNLSIEYVTYEPSG